MSDYSLMNPDDLKSEIRGLENEIVPSLKKLENETRESTKRIIDYFEDQYNDKNNDTIVLTRQQAHDLIATLTLSSFDAFRYRRHIEIYLEVYKNLLKDRRWLIAAKYLKFLRK